MGWCEISIPWKFETLHYIFPHAVLQVKEVVFHRFDDLLNAKQGISAIAHLLTEVKALFDQLIHYFAIVN